MFRKPRKNQEVTIHFERQDGEYSMGGKWIGENEDSVQIMGTVGQWIDKVLTFPKHRVVFIETHDVTAIEARYHEHWEDA